MAPGSRHARLLWSLLGVISGLLGQGCDAQIVDCAPGCFVRTTEHIYCAYPVDTPAAWDGGLWCPGRVHYLVRDLPAWVVLCADRETAAADVPAWVAAPDVCDRLDAGG